MLVHNLFGNMPVRVKQRALTCDGREQERLWEKLSSKLVALILAWGSPVTLALKNLESAKKLLIRARGDPRPLPLATGPALSPFNISMVRSVLSQAGLVEPSNWNKWVETTVATSSISIHGAISLQPAPSKNTQFISVGIHHVDPDLNSFLYDEVNRQFASSDFGKEDHPECERSPRKQKGKRSFPSEFTVKQLKGSGKGPDRWPMFVIRIDILDDSETRQKWDWEDERDGVLLDISSALGVMITRFLHHHHFRPHTKRPRLQGKKTDGAPVSSMKDGSTSESQLAKSEFLSLKSQDLGASMEKDMLEACSSRVQRSNHFEEGGKICSTSAQEAVVSRSVQSEYSSHRNLYLTHGFSTWSRIKSGKRQELEQLLCQPQTRRLRKDLLRDAEVEVNLTSPPKLLQQAVESSENSVEEVAKQADQSKGSAPGGDRDAETLLDERLSHSGSSSATNDPDKEPTLEDTISWTNPITGATVLLSTRTGLEMHRPLKPHGVFSNGESIALHGPKLTNANAKLKCGLSEPFGKPREGSWVSELLKTWNNPIFKPCEENIPRLALEGLHGADSGPPSGKSHRCFSFNLPESFRESSSSFMAKLSKEALSRSKLVAQVDQKFLLVCMNLNSSAEKGAGEEEGGFPAERLQRVLVLIDQHAADERIRVEGLLANLCRGPNPEEASTVPDAICSQSAIATIILPKPINFTIPHRESSLFMAYAPHFAEWGILYSLDAPVESQEGGDVPVKGCRLTVRALPEAIAERCRADGQILIDLLITEVWKFKDGRLGPKESADRSPSLSSSSTTMTCGEIPAGEPGQTSPDWLRQGRRCPQGILDLINSRACRSAIMFNDALTGEECQLLLDNLAQCAFPFQCAHGRPSMIPLVRVGEGEGDGLGITRDRLTSRLASTDEGRGKDREMESGEAWQRWIKERKREREGEEQLVVGG